MIQIQSEGRRHYLIGDTYPIKSQLRDAGAHWDGERRAWWTAKLDVAKRFANEEKAEVTPSSDRCERRDEKVEDSTPVLGKARYKGREYLLLWQGQTRRGEAAKLAFTDGSRIFWADAAEVQTTKTYDAREHRGQRQPMTFGRLQRLRVEYAEQKQAAKDVQLVGVEGDPDLVSQEHVAKNGAPGNLGETRWLRHRATRIAVVLVGYETAVYIHSEDAEDAGHFGLASGWYSVAHHRHATVAEYEALQARDPRADGTCAAIGEVIAQTLGNLAA